MNSIVDVLKRYRRSLNNSNFLTVFELNTVMVGQGYSGELQIEAWKHLAEKYLVDVTITTGGIVMFYKNKELLDLEQLNKILSEAIDKLEG